MQVAREGDSAAFLGSLFQFSVTLTAEKVTLMKIAVRQIFTYRTVVCPVCNEVAI